MTPDEIVENLITLYNNNQIGSIADYCYKENIDYRKILPILRKNKDKINFKIIDATVPKQQKTDISGYLLDYYEIKMVSGRILAKTFGYSPVSGNIFRTLKQHPLFLGRLTVTREYPEKFINNHKKDSKGISFRSFQVSEVDYELHIKTREIIESKSLQKGLFSLCISQVIEEISKEEIEAILSSEKYLGGSRRHKRINIGLTPKARQKIKELNNIGVLSYAVIVAALSKINDSKLEST